MLWATTLASSRITRFDDKALHCVLARPWVEPLALVLVSKNELSLDAAYGIPIDYVHSLDMLDARAALED